jgi:pimeloyl-ACP methyl ester carboxylesterase
LLSIDRPGIGLSDFQPNRTLLDWADDISELAQTLRLDRFALLGWSAGGPYVLACAFKIPHRLTRFADEHHPELKEVRVVLWRCEELLH